MSEQRAILTSILALRTLFALLLTISTLGAIGCDSPSSERQAPQTVTINTIRLLYPSEARTLILGAIERFNAKNLPLANGSVARLTGASFDDYAAVDKVGAPPTQAALWIPPLSPLAAIVKGSTKGEVEIGECHSLMSTTLGVALRQIDTFTLPADTQKLSIMSLLSPQDGGNRSPPAIIVGGPRFSSSGLLAALATSAEVAGVPIERLSPESISTSLTRLAMAQKRVRNYFVSDHQALQWLAAREGGDPIDSITTEQATRAFKTYHPEAQLEWFPFTSPSASLDYPLCDILYKNDSAQDLETAKLARSFFSSEEFKSLASAAGFSPPLPNKDSTNGSVGGAIQNLLASWSKIRRASNTIFVVDTSVKTDQATIETIRRELTAFTGSRPSQEDMVAIVSASSDPEVSREPTTDPELIRLAISRLTTTGGNAIRDGIETAFTIFEGVSSTEYRRSIVVFTSAKDTSSQTSVEELRNRASQLVGRRNVDLFVLAIGRSEQDFGELPALTRRVGGTFVLTEIASLPGNFYAVARRIQ